jgi:predicted Rossmann fold nucleotide-binding protein DprA/Smf involved in DNA uptake
MIKTAACACLTDVSDVLSVFGMTYTDAKANTVTQLSFEARMVLDALKHDELHFDEIVQRTNFAPKILTTLLTTMEMGGLLEKLAGNYYVKQPAGIFAICKSAPFPSMSMITINQNM